MSLLFLLLTAVLFYNTNVVANTEIINFAASSEQNVDVSAVLHWPILRPNRNEIHWKLLPAPFGTPLRSVCTEPHHVTNCSHELWVTLDLDDQAWTKYSKFTLRLSWPASFPADFLLETMTPEELASHLDVSVPLEQGLTRVKYARVRIVDAGVPVPVPGTSSKPPPDVPFILIVEPLYLGVLPASMLSLAISLSVILAFAGFGIVPRVNAYFQGLATEARKDIQRSNERKPKAE